MSTRRRRGGSSSRRPSCSRSGPSTSSRASWPSRRAATYVIPGGESSLLVTTDFTTWGWALIIWGIVLILAAASLFAGRSWARWFAIFVIIINGIGQIAWFPAYPLWSLLAIGLEIAVLWALTVGWKDARAELRS